MKNQIPKHYNNNYQSAGVNSFKDMPYLRFKRFGLSVDKDPFSLVAIELTSVVGAILSLKHTPTLLLTVALLYVNVCCLVKLFN